MTPETEIAVERLCREISGLAAALQAYALDAARRLNEAAERLKQVVDAAIAADRATTAPLDRGAGRPEC